MRLVLNVYKDTSLYRSCDSGSGEDMDVNKTLNSQVIAAQVSKKLMTYSKLQAYEMCLYLKDTSDLEGCEKIKERS